MKKKGPKEMLTYFGGLLNNINDPAKRTSSEAPKFTPRTKAAYGEVSEENSLLSRSWFRDTVRKKTDRGTGRRQEKERKAKGSVGRLHSRKPKAKAFPCEFHRDSTPRPKTASLETTSANYSLLVQKCPMTSQYSCGKSLWRSSHSALHISKGRSHEHIFCNEEIRKSTEPKDKDKMASKSVRAVINIPFTVARASPTKDLC